MCCGDGGIAVFSSLNALIQSSASIAIGVIGILAYQCVIVPPMTEFTYPEIPTYPPGYPSGYPPVPSKEDQKAINIDISGYQVTISDPFTIFMATFYQQYFYSKDNCIAQNATAWASVNETQIGVITKPHQVESILYAYAIINGLWFLVSLMLLSTGACTKKRGVFIIQSFIQCLVIIYDIILVIFFALDFQTYDQFPTSPDVPWITPDLIMFNIIVMLAIFSRFVGFFIINVNSFFLVVTVVRNLGRTKPTDEDVQRPLAYAPPPMRAYTNKGYQPYAPPHHSHQQSYYNNGHPARLQYDDRHEMKTYM